MSKEQVGTTIIEPVSSRFTKVATIIDYKQKEIVDGEEIERKLPFSRVKRFPGTNQEVMPYFDGKLGYFKIIKEDGTLWTQKDLDNLVEEVPLNYEYYNAPNKSLIGTRIPKANIKDWTDAYLAHHQWKVKLYEGARVLKDSKYLEKYYADILRGNGKVGIENAEGTMAGDVEYVVKRPALAKERAIKNRDTKMSAFDLYKKMMTDRDKLVGIMRLFNVDVDPDSSISDLQDAVWEKADDSVTTLGGNTHQKLFVHYASLPKLDFKIREMIALGSIRGKLPLKGGMYYFDEVPVGSTYEDMIEYFKNDNNSSRRDALKLMLELK